MTPIIGHKQEALQNLNAQTPEQFAAIKKISWIFFFFQFKNSQNF
jgi:hypothetical protein